LDTAQGGGHQPKVLVNISEGNLKTREDFNCLDANYHKGLDNHAQRTGVLEVRPVLTPDRAEKRQIGRRIKNDGEPMFTLTAQDRHGVAISIDLKSVKSSTRRGMFKEEHTGTLDSDCNIAVTRETRIRRLTPKECWRLQGVSDEITNKVIAAGISDTQMYRGAGDACTVNLFYEIAKKLKYEEEITEDEFLRLLS
jgi:DNA (cytosine-5)-methyltransferase 1